MRADPAPPLLGVPLPDPLALRGRGRVGLEEVVEEAARMTRVDRKYLVSRAVAESFLERLASSFRVLSIGGRDSTAYSSVYFDTARLDACRDHVQQRRRRWKVRSRLYVEDQLCRFEVKTRDGRGVTHKTVTPSEPARHGRLGPVEAAFVTRTLDDRGLDVDVASLGATMRVDYRRLTLADTDDHLRVTLDLGVQCTLEGGRVWVDEAWVLVETKGGRRPSPADVLLGSLGARPRSFSKYVSAASLLRADIPDNDVRQLRGRQLHAREAVA
ncbi:polyphosphate polymerase domain-containing protein [Nocardioides rubriscoriae]|uniref:polyphosphate polymerase domain-containing protein n=1 Tax=Nocardioides rubriscoriae TaxID=642762 RepID=UPI0011DF3A4B|nr:polyphosphate polymerase domain-containing protein [Nocardioides rubriscoriae]